MNLEDAILKLKIKPFEEMGYAKIDNHRAVRKGIAEVIYGEGMKKVVDSLGREVEVPENVKSVVCDGATWHKSKGLKIPENIEIIHIPPYTPEMNPIEQIWKQIRSMGFRNEFFNSLSDVVNKLCETINNLTKEMVKSITHRDWLFL